MFFEKGKENRENFKIELCNADYKPIKELVTYNKIEKNDYIADIDTIEFLLYPYIYSKNKRIKNIEFDLVKEGKFIHYYNIDEGENNNGKYYYINKVLPNYEENSITFKKVICSSAEILLGTKKVIDYDLIGRKIYDNHNRLDENGFHIGFLNYLEERTGWKVGTISPTLEEKYRELKFSNKSFLNCLKDCMDKYQCYFEFDTYNQIINVVDVEFNSGNSGIVISDKNFIKALKTEINDLDVVTRMYIFGSNNCSINSEVINGKPYIENFDFYKKNGYMSKELVDALDKYEEAEKKLEPTFVELNNKLGKQKEKLSSLWTEIVDLESEIHKNEEQLDVAIRENDYDTTPVLSTDKYKKELDKLNSQLKDKLKEHSNLSKEVDKTSDDILNIGKELDIKKFINEKNYKELDRFIKEDIVNDNSFSDGMNKELLKFGKEQLKKKSYPILQFDINLKDFFKISKFKDTIERIKLGDKIYLNCEELNFDYRVKLIGIEREIDKNNIKMIFSNVDSITDSNIYLANLISEMKSVTTSVSVNSNDWDKGKYADTTIKKYINENLDLAKQQIVTSQGQKPLIDDRGIWLYKENPDGSIDNKQIRMINNVIAFSNDNWDTVQTAISGDGINAKAVRGELGEFVTINANQIKVFDDTITESEISKYIKENGGRTYKQQNPPDIEIKEDGSLGSSVDEKINISDGSLWLRTDRYGNVVNVFRYNKEYSNNKWDNIGGFKGSNHWQEISDIVLKDKNYGGAKLGNNGLYTTSNGVTINSEGINVKNTKYGTTLTTKMNSDGFKIDKNGNKVFEVNSNGELELRANNGAKLLMDGNKIKIVGGSDTLTIDNDGISLPNATSLTIGNKGSNRYICISNDGVSFGTKLRYDMNGKLYINGEEVAKMDDLYRLERKLRNLANKVDGDSDVPCYVVFG